MGGLKVGNEEAHSSKSPTNWVLGKSKFQPIKNQQSKFNIAKSPPIYSPNWKIYDID